MNNQSGKTREALRGRMRLLRAQLSGDMQQKFAVRTAQWLFALQAYRQSRTVMAYIAARGELSLSPVIEDLLASGRQLALPRCEDAGIMTARLVSHPNQLQRGAYGLMEPDQTCKVIPPEEIDLILVPGVAFDRAGNRLGQGGGYYDRYLPQTHALRVGICHDFALLDHLSAQIHDAPMDMIITPEGVHPPEAKKHNQ